MGALHIVDVAPDARAGDILHIVSGEVVGLDRNDDYYRLARLWGFVPSAVVREVVSREGWDERALSAAGAFVHARPLPETWRAPEAIARAIPDRRAANAGLVGGRAGVYAATWHYDRVSAYPTLAAAGVPDPRRWRVDAAVPRDESACGYVVGDFRLAPLTPGLTPDADNPAWLTLDEYRALSGVGAVTGRIARVYVTRRVRWDWFDRVRAELYEKRETNRDAKNVYKAALNGLVGRFAARGLYERLVLGSGAEIIKTRDGYVHATRVVDSRTRSYNASLTHDVIARQRLDIWRVMMMRETVWWYVDAVVTTAPLPDELCGTAPGQWRMLAAGESRIISWQGGLVAGREKIASVPRARWRAWLSRAGERG